VGKKTRLIKGVLFLSALTLLPLVQAQDQPPIQEECLAYAFTQSEGHSFLLHNNSLAYGNQVFIRTNCDQYTVSINGEFFGNFGSRYNFFEVENGTMNLTITSGNYSYVAENVVIFQNQFTWSENYQVWLDDQPQMTFIELGAMVFQENVVSVASIVIVWFLAVNVYWALINHYLDRNLFEEVVE
jgi:hypothetical protein